MPNYFLRNLNVVLNSSDQDTSTIDLIVEFETLDYSVKLLSDATIDGQITLTYEIDSILKPSTLFHNGFVYPKHLEWDTNKFLNIIVIVEFPLVTEASSVVKDEKDVIKPGGGIAD
jgi:hypothetical protein